MAKHKEYVGWQAGDGVVKTLRETGTISRDAKATGRIAMVRYGIAFRTTLQDAQGFTDDAGFQC